MKGPLVELSLFASIPLSTAPAPFRRGVCINHTRDMLCQNPPWKPRGSRPTFQIPLLVDPKTEAAGVHAGVHVPSRSLFSRPALQRRPNPCPFLSPIRAWPPLPPCAYPVLTRNLSEKIKQAPGCMYMYAARLAKHRHDQSHATADCEGGLPLQLAPSRGLLSLPSAHHCQCSLLLSNREICTEQVARQQVSNRKLDLGKKQVASSRQQVK